MLTERGFTANLTYHALSSGIADGLEWIVGYPENGGACPVGAFFVNHARGRRFLCARDLSDETGDQALDLGRRQVVAGIPVRQAHIAANDEGAQARLGEALCPG